MKLIFGRKVVQIVVNDQIGSQMQLSLQVRQADTERVEELKALCAGVINYIDTIWKKTQPKKFTVAINSGNIHTAVGEITPVKKYARKKAKKPAE